MLVLASSPGSSPEERPGTHCMLYHTITMCVYMLWSGFGTWINPCSAAPLCPAGLSWPRCGASRPESLLCLQVRCPLFFLFSSLHYLPPSTSPLTTFSLLILASMALLNPSLPHYSSFSPLSSSSLPVFSPLIFLLSLIASYSKRSNFISRLPPKQRTNLNSYLEYLGEVCTCRYICVASISAQMDKASQLIVVHYEMIVFCATSQDACACMW